jgi:hypothetical protein
MSMAYLKRGKNTIVVQEDVWAEGSREIGTDGHLIAAAC